MSGNGNEHRFVDHVDERILVGILLRYTAENLFPQRRRQRIVILNQVIDLLIGVWLIKNIREQFCNIPAQYLSICIQIEFAHFRRNTNRTAVQLRTGKPLKLVDMSVCKISGEKCIQQIDIVHRGRRCQIPHQRIGYILKIALHCFSPPIINYNSIIA